MKRGTVYCGLDGLDVLETMGDNQISLIYLDIPDQVGIESKRINYDENGKNPVSTLIKEKKCLNVDVSNEDIHTFIEKCEDDRKRAYEEYLFKIVQNCFRVLNDDGFIICRERGGESDYVDLIYILKNVFHKLETKVMEQKSDLVHKNRFDLFHFFSKRFNVECPQLYELQPKEMFPYRDVRGEYKLISLVNKYKKNAFEWNGYCPPEEQYWCYPKDKLNELNENGYIEIKEFNSGKKFPMLKYYREEHPVKVSPIWNEKEIWERIFSLFVKEGDKVLGIYEGLEFAYYAEKNKLVWYTILEHQNKERIFKGDGKIKNKFEVVDNLNECIVKKYENPFAFLTDIHISKRTYYETMVKRFEKNDNKLSNLTTDEILIHYMDKYLRKEGITQNKFAEYYGIPKRTLATMRKKVYETKVLRSEKKKISAGVREKNTILTIAVYAKMNFPETEAALKASGLDFDNNHPVDVAIREWMCGNDKNINTLNRLINQRCKERRIPYNKYTYTPSPRDNSQNR